MFCAKSIDAAAGYCRDEKTVQSIPKTFELIKNAIRRDRLNKKNHKGYFQRQKKGT